MSHERDLSALRESLAALAEGHLTTADLCSTWRSQRSLLAALPPRYGEVLETLLASLESGSLFGDESCSFSQHDLRSTLSDWLDKAQQKLAG